MWVQPNEYAALGACLAEARRRARITQDELAARLEKPQSFVSSYERGQRRVDVLELLVILAALQADPVEVFSGIVAQMPTRAPRRHRGAKPRKR